MTTTQLNTKGETMKNLTASQWNQIISLPADGVSYNIPGIAFRAVHKPQTKMSVEQVIAETQFGTLRRRYSGGKWQRVEYIAGRAV